MRRLAMRFPQLCPQCNYRPRLFVKHQVLRHHREGEEIIAALEYPCGHIIHFNRPYKEVEGPNGYVGVATPDGQMPVHRYTWEQAHGKLAPGMVVHHINGKKNDNRLENLVAMPRRKHNGHMSQSEPIEVVCPHCQQTIRVIKESNKRYAGYPMEELSY